MPARLLVVEWVLAVLVLPVLACEMDPPAYDASSYPDPSLPQEPSQEPAREARPALMSRAPAQAKSARASHAIPQAPSSSPETSEPDAVPDRPALRAFYAAGETRFLCPAGYSARATTLGSCDCAASAAGVSPYPMEDGPCGDGAARVEGNECIFTCRTGP